LSNGQESGQNFFNGLYVQTSYT